MQTILDRILVDVRAEVEAARAARPPSEIRAMLADAPDIRSLASSLGSGGFGILAEIKAKSPSVGAMREENLREAPAAYQESPIVRGISVLTNQTHFGGGIQNLSELRKQTHKPLLRKDFLLSEYQVIEARAFGADAVLLMASVLDAARLKGFFELASEHGMAVLFEVHSAEEIAMLPRGAEIVGINSRKFRATSGFSGAEGHSQKDFSVDLGVFDLVGELPKGVLTVAESGLSAENIAEVATRFDAALVGTSLLRDPRGIRAHLEEFQAALAENPEGTPILA